MKILHISALPVWPMNGKGGMPSLRETLRGHLRAGHEVLLVLPRYNVLGDHANPVSTRDDEGYSVHVAPCAWAPRTPNAPCPIYLTWRICPETRNCPILLRSLTERQSPPKISGSAAVGRSRLWQPSISTAHTPSNQIVRPAPFPQAMFRSLVRRARTQRPLRPPSVAPAM